MQILFFSFLLCFISSSSWAGEIVLGISTGYPPYYYHENGELKGICIEVVNGVAQEMQLDITYKVFPWKRLLFSARQGKVDAIMPLFRTKEREQFLYFDGLSIALETNHFFTRREFPLNYKGNFADVLPYPIGVVADYSYGQAFDQFKNFNKVVTLNDKHLVEMFAHHRFDIAIGNRYVTLFYAKQHNMAKEIKFLEPPITKEMLYIGFVRNHGQVARGKQFAEALGRFKHTKNYQKIVQKYSLSD